MNIKFYRGPAVDRDTEVPATDAPALPTYTKAYFSDDGVLRKAEVYDRGKEIEVGYYDVDDLDQVIASHLRDSPGVRFSIWTTLREYPGYVWKFVRSYDGAAAPTGFSKILSDADRRELMQIEMDERHHVTRITKYYWNSDGSLRYVFEFDKNGELFSVTDVLYGDHASLADIEPDLEDVDFFKRGWALPHTLSATPLPSDPQ
jgi:hypothetical protein